MWWGLVPTSPWGNLHPVPTAMLIVTISGHTVSTGSRFPWLYINCFQSPWFQCIMIKYGIFPWWVSRGGVHVFEKRRGMKKETIGGGGGGGGGWYTFPHYEHTDIHRIIDCFLEVWISCKTKQEFLHVETGSQIHVEERHWHFQMTLSNIKIVWTRICRIHAHIYWHVFVFN